MNAAQLERWGILDDGKWGNLNDRWHRFCSLGPTATGEMLSQQLSRAAVDDESEHHQPSRPFHALPVHQLENALYGVSC